MKKVISVIMMLVVVTSCSKDEIPEPLNQYLTADYIPVNRTITGIELAQQGNVTYDNVTYNTDFYRNLSYDAGIEGKYTFLVLNPANNPSGEAPLWVYFHGGSVGYYNDQQQYQCLKRQNELSWNKEETYENLVNDILGERLFDDGVLRDNTLSRRIQEGYRLLVLSYSDHDFYMGTGIDYPNNPYGGQVNGLQASMSAVDFVAANYPTTYVYSHGTSAGGVGAYAMGVAYYLEGTRLSGIISDCGPLIAQGTEIYDEYEGHPESLQMPTFKGQGVLEKIGVFGNFENGLYAESMVSNGFDTPLLSIAGKADPYYNCHLPVMSKAIADGYDNNVDWLFRNLIVEIEEQPNSLHKVLILDNTGHVPSIKNNPTANNTVDDFIDNILSTNPAIPFN
jgi:hypothetical protein